MELYIIRHGETVWNAAGLLQGEHDIELNENGRNLAIAYGKEISDIHFDKIFSSPLKRAFETASLILNENNHRGQTSLVTDDRLREVSFGAAEGTDFHCWRDESCPYHTFFDAPEKYIPPENGEYLTHLCERTKEFVKEKIETEIENCNRIMIVAHGALNASIMTYLEQNDMHHFWGKGLQKNCQATIFEFDGKMWIRKN